MGVQMGSFELLKLSPFGLVEFNKVKRGQLKSTLNPGRMNDEPILGLGGNRGNWGPPFDTPHIRILPVPGGGNLDINHRRNGRLHSR